MKKRVLAVLLSLCLAFSGMMISNAMTPSEAVSKGIDVSSHMGTINWSLVKPNIDFAIIRCGYGGDRTSQDDSQWANNVKGCEQNNIPFGVYLYSYAVSAADAKSEAEHVIRLLKGHNPQLPVFYDIEDATISSSCSKKQILENAKIFCTTLKNAGYQVGIYANKYWWTTYLTDSTYDQWERWVAQYNSTCTYTGSFNYWQYSQSGSIPGISAKNVDMDYSKLSFTGGNHTNAASPFKDVPSNAWYAGYVNKAVELGLMSGVGSNSFNPMGKTSRAMFVQVLYAMKGSPAVTFNHPFTDVSNNQWYAKAVQWAYTSKVTSGLTPTTFGPSENVTREQMAVFLYSYAGKPAVTGNLSAFKDGAKVSSWAKNAMIWATRSGVISGSKNSDGSLNLNPQNPATRAECATMVVNFHGMMNK